MSAMHSLTMHSGACGRVQVPRLRALQRAPFLATLLATCRGPLLAAFLAGASLSLAQAQVPAPAQRVAATAELAQAEALIEALVQRGLLPRARADVLIREARARAGVSVESAVAAAATPKLAAASPAAASPREAAAEAEREAQRKALRDEVRAEVMNEVRDDILARADTLAKAAAVASAGAASAASAAPPATEAAAAATPPAPDPKVIRVPYVPQVVRDQIRTQIKEEVLAQARAEQWGAGPAAPAWVQRITVEGDLRVRHQADRYDGGNLSPNQFLLASLTGATRAADLAAGSAAGLATGNTQDNRERWRLRARLGFNARLNDITATGIRLATGSATDRVSTNQTMGQGGNRYSFLLDRAFIRVDATPWLAVSAGRIANPWFATDLQWSDNLNFEGLAASLRWPGTLAAGVEPFATVGYFPLREDGGVSPARALSGVQTGLQWDQPRTRLRLGLAAYHYSKLAGRVDTDYDATTGAGRSYGQYEYGAALRQRGNTLFLTNSNVEVAAGLTPDRFRWGLASRFTPVVLTLATELTHFAPFTLQLSAEAVRNTAFDRDEIKRRTGITLTDGSASGLAFKAVFGSAAVRQRGQWQGVLGYRRVGSDAVLDAFTDSDLRLGGTNVTGYSAALLLGLDRELSLGLRYLSGRSLDSMTVQPGQPTGFGVNSLQVDLNARF